MNYPYIHIFWVGLAIGIVVCLVTKHTCDAIQQIAPKDDLDSPEWD